MVNRCECSDLKPKMILNRFVVSIYDIVLADKFQMDLTLTLEKAQKLMKQMEAIHGQLDTLKDPKRDSSVTSEYSFRPCKE